MAGQAKVYFKVANDTTPFGVALQINSFVYDIATNKLWDITVAATAADTLSTVTKTQVNAGGGGASAFTDLTDVPASYAGQGGKVVSVKADVSGLEFTAPSGGASDITDLTNSSTVKTSITDTWYFQLWVSAKTWYVVTFTKLKEALGLNITATKTLTVTDDTTLNGGTHSGDNTGDQDLSGKADTDLSNIDISGLTEETAPNDNDILLLQADSDSSVYKVKKSNICGNSDIEYVSIFENDFILYANYSATSAYMYIVDNLTVSLTYSSVVNSALTNTRDGIWKMTVTNTSNGSDANIASGLSIIAGGGIIILKGSFMIDSLFTSTQDALIIFGLTGTPGISVRYEYSANSSNFLIYHRTSGTVYAIIDTGLAVVAQTWYDVEIISNANATLWQVYINGTQYGGDITTDIPDVTIPTYVNCRLVKKVGDNTSRIVYWDFFKYKKIFTNAR